MEIRLLFTYSAVGEFHPQEMRGVGPAAAKAGKGMTGSTATATIPSQAWESHPPKTSRGVIRAMHFRDVPDIGGPPSLVVEARAMVASHPGRRRTAPHCIEQPRYPGLHQ